MKRVGIFWDYENCKPPPKMSGFSIVGKIRQVVLPLGGVSLFRTYMDANSKSTTATQQQEMQLSAILKGVSLVHIPNAGKKEVTDKILLVDLMLFALENREPSTLVLITAEHDINYALSVLRLRGHEIHIVSPSASVCHSSRYLVDNYFDWKLDILESNDSAAKTRVLSGRVCVQPIGPRDAISQSSDALWSYASSSSSGSVSAGFNQSVHADVENIRNCTNADTEASIIEKECNISSDSLGSGWSLRSLPSSYSDTHLQDLTSSVQGVISAGFVDPWASQAGNPVENDVWRSSSHAETEGSSLDDEEPWSEDCVLRPSTTKDITIRKISGTDAELIGRESELNISVADTHAVTAHEPSTLPVSPGERFRILIDVLAGDRARGLLSTSHIILGNLLQQLDPNIYQHADVVDLKEYLEVARQEKIVFFSGSDWGSKEIYVFLHSKWIPLDVHKSNFVVLSQALETFASSEYKKTPFAELKERVLILDPGAVVKANALNFKHYILLALGAGLVEVDLPMFVWVKPISQNVVTDAQASYSQLSAWTLSTTEVINARPSQAQATEASPQLRPPKKRDQIDPVYATLIYVLRELREQGVYEIKRWELPGRLLKRDPGIYQRAGIVTTGTKIKSYVSKALAAGVVVLKPGGEGEKRLVMVQLHPDYW
ncbi:hypothetical protein EW145_g5016 [Phellinidium pouzarii]|uniref:NYN domain-containing protein n=1 Tax=Phellinidium pouzarii TaxID=167371 RepID=A0A4S4L1I7_9AGAM|nr:hypothetical protein EW145_g5016 [Phellinidium pouzarii]